MYKSVKIEEKIRVPPELLGREVEDSIEGSLQEQYTGEINEDLGVVIAVEEIEEIGEGKIEPEDAGVYYPVIFKAIVLDPELHEIVEGEVSEVTDFGAFVRIGPIDAMCHISQIMDNYVDYDEKQGMLVGEDGKRNLKEGDSVRARITAVSFNESGENKLNLTMRQPALGKHEWIEEDFEEDEEEEDD